MPEDKTKAKLNINKDYYYILGVPADASPQTIQNAYGELHDKFGPHVGLQSMDPDIQIKTFKDISEAYEILMDPVKRKEYDQLSHDLRSSHADIRALWTKHSAEKHPTEFKHIPGGSDDKDPKVQALALEMEIEVTLKEAIKGARKQIKISDPRPCQDCAGLKPVNRMQCPNCRGLGYFNVERTEDVDMPAGLYDGMEIRKASQGRYDLRASRNGDLIIKVKLKPHPFLHIVGKDVTCTIPVTIYEAMLGAEIEIPCATGKVVMRVQPLTQPGRVYRLKGLGLAGADQLVTVEVVLPQQLSAEEANLYRKLKELNKEPNPRDAVFSKL